MTARKEPHSGTFNKGVCGDDLVLLVNTDARKYGQSGQGLQGAGRGSPLVGISCRQDCSGIGISNNERLHGDLGQRGDAIATPNEGATAT